MCGGVVAVSACVRVCAQARKNGHDLAVAANNCMLSRISKRRPVVRYCTERKYMQKTEIK